MAANHPNLELNSRVCQSICCRRDNILTVKMLNDKTNQNQQKQQLPSLKEISKEQATSEIGYIKDKNVLFKRRNTFKLVSSSSKLEAAGSRKTFDWSSPFASSSFIDILHSVTFLLIINMIIIECLLTSLAAAQCPWTRETAELHSDCICDFNPSQTTNLESNTNNNQHLINRMSVQCSPVNFQQLLKALKQSASIELPRQLLSNPTTGSSSSIRGNNNNNDARDIQTAALQLASQTKLDLLHVSNSSIKQLTDNTFIVDLAIQSSTDNEKNNTLPPALEVRHLVVAIQSLHLSRCGIESIQANAFNGLEWSLTSLSLSDNQLETIPVSALRRLINLKVLDLSNNKLFHIRANSFSTLNKLNTLRLADNNRLGLQQTPTTTTTTTSSLPLFPSIFKSKQNFSNASSRAIDLQAFVGLEASLTDLNLKNTHLESFPIALKTLRNLAFLNLAQNQISHIPPKSFEFINSLTAINIERNRISSIENDTFLGVENSLSSLSLLGNLLETYPVHQLSRLNALRRLDIGFNRIEILPPNSFVSNKRLILIALDGNPLETLPEETFKPLEGILRGMSIGGKSLNCDCHLSWMLRWQLDFNLQISSREREPQFCGKPYYLRSLVSFKALKPEHLTCSADSATSSMTDSVTTNYIGQTFQGSAIHQFVNQPTRANLSGLSTTSGGWTANEPQTNSYSYFTLPVQFTVEPTEARTTRLSSPSTPFWQSNLSLGNQKEASSYGVERPETSTAISEPPEGITITEIDPKRITKTTTSPPTISKNDDLGREEKQQSPPISLTEYLGTTDLVEASTNEEPTIRDEDQFAATTELNVVNSSFVPPRMDTNLMGVMSLYGDRTITTTTASNYSDSSVQAGQNNLASLPADELFATNQASRKTNRNGYLASSQRFKSPPSATLEEILRSTGRQQEQTATNFQQQGTTTITKLPFHLLNPDLMRRNNNSGNRSTTTTTTTVAPAFEPAMDPGTRIKPIKSVFGSRAGENTSSGQKREYRRPTSLLPQQQQVKQLRLSTSSPPVVPAVPTTVNVYKMQHQAHSNNNDQSSHQQALPTNSSIGSLFKGARFVDDNPSSISNSVRNSARNSGSQIPLLNQTATKQQPQHHQVIESQLVDSDIERYTATSNNVNTRVSSINQHQQPPAGSTQATKPTNDQKPQKDSDWETTTIPTTTTTAFNDDQFQSRTTTSQPQLVTTQANRIFANNTRMSVSSMYRLANGSLSKQGLTSTTTASPSVVMQNATASSSPNRLEAAAESETQKITRNPSSTEAQNVPFLLTTTYRQLLSNRINLDNKRTTANSSPTSSTNNDSTSPKITWTSPMPATSSTGLSTAGGSVSQTTREPYLTTKPISRSNSSSSSSLTQPEQFATTRMATSVRFVDSSPPLVRISSSQSTSSTTSNVTIPIPIPSTVRPQVNLVTKSVDKIVWPPLESSSSIPSRFATNSTSTDSSPPGLFESSLPSVELSKFKVAQQDLIEVKQSSSMAAGIPTTTTTRRPNQAEHFSPNRNNVVVVGEQQHEARLILTSNSKTTKQPVLHAVGSQVIQPIDQLGSSSYQEQPTSFSMHPIDTQRDQIKTAKDNFGYNQRQGRDDSSAFTFSGNAQNFLGKLIRMADFDQLALILAALLCLFILVLALTIICVCCSSWISGKKRDKNAMVAATSSSKLSSFSSNLRLSNNIKYKHKQSLFRSIFCCFCSDRANNKITPMRSLILQDDDNSSGGGSSSNDTSNGLKVATGKSMLLSSNNASNTANGSQNLLDSFRNTSTMIQHADSGKVLGSKQAYSSNTFVTTGRKPLGKQNRPQSYDDSDCVFTSSKPLDHDIGIKNHRQAHEYFIGVATQPVHGKSGKSIGRRRSMLDAGGSSSRDLMGNLSERELAEDVDGNDENRNDWICEDTLSSCDSDKSCSPGANKNNRYNISEAHRAHLKSKNAASAAQIQARMFVTTSLGPQKSSNSSNLLLRTIENNNPNYSNHYQQQLDATSNMPPVDYFDRISRMSSDKSTTDDSRAPLSSTTKASRSTARLLHHNYHQYHHNTKPRNSTTQTFKAPQIRRSKSISNNNRIQPNLVPIGREVSADLLNSDLVPMSAEEQWPEPYIDPADQEAAEQQQQQAQAIQHHNYPRSQFAIQFRQPPTEDQYETQQQNLANHHHRSQNAIQAGNQRRSATHKRTGSGFINQAFTYHDDAYLTNWHTMSRSRQRHGEYSTREHNAATVDENEDFFHNHPDALANNQSTLIRYRSIPSLNGFPHQLDNLQQQQQPNQSSNFLSSQIGGATNWLRWTPTSFMNQNRSLAVEQNTKNNIPEINKHCAEIGSSSSHKQFKGSTNADTNTSSPSETIKSRLQNNGQQQGLSTSTHAWHRDNFVEAVYVAANQHR